MYKLYIYYILFNFTIFLNVKLIILAIRVLKVNNFTFYIKYY